MWKSIIFKEWIKIRWFLLLFVTLGVLIVGYIFLNVRHDFNFNQANNYWYLILFQGFQYFGYLKFVPVAGGLAIALAQFFPETVSKRIKLTFHLPINENKVLLTMMTFGTGCLSVAYLIFLSLFCGLSALFFPSNIILPALASVVPWFLSGFVVYYFTTLIVLEPVWKFRFFYIVVAAAFFPLFLKPGPAGAYAPVNVNLAVFTIFLSISLLFSGYRFRKGEM